MLAFFRAGVMKVAKLCELLPLFASPRQQLWCAGCPAWQRFRVTKGATAPFLPLQEKKFIHSLSK